MPIAPWSRPSRFPTHQDPLRSAFPFSATTRAAPPNGYSKLPPCELFLLEPTTSSPISLFCGPCLTPSWAIGTLPCPTRSDMQRWLGAFPTPGPLPCSPDTIYEDCGE